MGVFTQAPKSLSLNVVNTAFLPYSKQDNPISGSFGLWSVSNSSDANHKLLAQYSTAKAES